MNVSRETTDQLKIYLDLLRKWSPRINLVSKASLDVAAERHFSDSLQLVELCPSAARHWVDLGSGAGFPGAVVAIALAESDTRVTLVESDQRKAAFLRTVSRETNVPFNVVAERIESLEPLEADVLSARALAPVDVLLQFTNQHMKKSGTAFFPKGERWKNEIAHAEKQWRFSLEIHKSKTSANAAILQIGDLSRV